ncbi:uncharacterized protein LOC124291502 [Haliotis rubra]|uniref:uncharacterized protein LOC124291502 n=1 Tax=Haliotis rubra TaxID=36100 RepID=UPI001EE5A78D|nr:uncharacterized protein LOC124291502 [Haliotis rubra]
MDDNLYTQILNFYTNSDKKYPQHIYDLDPDTRLNAKSHFRQTAKPFWVANGIVFHGEREVLTKSRLPSILKACHDNPATGGHFGRDKTFGKISSRCYWKGMKNNLQENTRRDRSALSSIRKSTQKHHHYTPFLFLPKSGASLELTSSALYKRLQETTSSNKYIVAVTDHFSKWSEAAAIPDKSAKEHDNRTLKAALSKLVNNQVDDWDQYIPGVLFAYHTSVHASTKCTPFEVMYGRPAKLSIDLKPTEGNDSTATASSPNTECPEVLQTIIDLHKGIWSTVSNNISNAQDRQKENYDR